VRAVSEAHGGSVIIDRSSLGGARVTVVLPWSLIVESEGDDQ